ncbi:MAG: hypothetical protein E7324_08930 [Clostridiales bacterium]|nr:hypothetical protein [Clostridiales bacterium]
MAMDNFREEVVIKQKRGMETAMYAMANVMMVIFGVLAVMTFSSISMFLSTEGFSANTIFNIVALLVDGGMCAFLFLRKDRLKMEYEYTFTNGQMDFAQVYNNKKRKALGTMNIRNVEACGMVASGSFQRYITMQGVKRTNWFLNREADLLYFYFQKDGSKRMIIIEPSEEMIVLIKKYLAQGVWQVN